MSIWSKVTNYSPTTYFAISLIAKDAIGCVMYTSTARNNKRYTPEKRADVANYDLANGIINILLQIAAIKPIEAGFKKLAETKFMQHFIKDVDTKMASTDSKFLKQVMSRKSALVKGSTALLSVAICQYVIKRFISPYFSMPVSEKFQEWGLVKPKLYAGETYNKKNKFEVMADAANEQMKAANEQMKQFGQDAQEKLSRKG